MLFMRSSFTRTRSDNRSRTHSSVGMAAEVEQCNHEQVDVENAVNAWYESSLRDVLAPDAWCPCIIELFC